jgi:ubiquinone/menaquinone biosynthesis C-methylase UbiE
MISLGILKVVNKLFPAKNVGGRKSPQDYSLTEYAWAQRDYEQIRHLLPLENKVVLDAGCGLGGRTAYYSEQGATSITGIDIDENHISFSKEFMTIRNISNVKLLVANFIDIPLESNQFDVVIMNDVVEHIRVEFLEKAFLELKRLLKPGGKLFLEFPPWTSPYAAHLYDQIAIPWCHLLFPEKTLLTFIENKNAGERMGRLSSIEHFHELNRLNKKPFIRMMKKLGFTQVYYNQKIIKNLNFLKIIPGISELATNRIAGIYTKETPDPGKIIS